MVDARGWATASTTLLPLNSLCGGGVPSSHPSLGLSVFFLSFFLGIKDVAARLSSIDPALAWDVRFIYLFIVLLLATRPGAGTGGAEAPRPCQRA